MTRLLRRLRYWLHRGRMDADLAEEMEFHRAMLTEDGGARAAMGSTMLAREDARGVWIWPWLESLWQDVAYGARTLRRQPGFTITALLALGSAIGLNTSLFTIFNSFALRPWPVHDPSRVLTVHRFVRERRFGASLFYVVYGRLFAHNDVGNNDASASYCNPHVDFLCGLCPAGIPCSQSRS